MPARFPPSRSPRTGARSTPVGWTTGSSSGTSPAIVASHVRSRSRSRKPGCCAITHRRSRSARPGETVAAGLPDGGIRLHDARTLRRLPDLPGLEDEPVSVVEFSPDGRDGRRHRRERHRGAARRGERPAGAAAAGWPRCAGAGDGVLARRRPPRRSGPRRQPAGTGSGNRRCRADGAARLPDQHVLQPRRRAAGDRAQGRRHGAARS